MVLKAVHLEIFGVSRRFRVNADVGSSSGCWLDLGKSAYRDPRSSKREKVEALRVRKSEKGLCSHSWASRILKLVPLFKN